MRALQGVPSLVFHLSDRGGGDLNIVGPPGTDAYMSSIRTFVNRRHPAQHIVEVAVPSGHKQSAEHGYVYSTADDDPAPFAWAQAKTPGSGLEITALPFSIPGTESDASRFEPAQMPDGSAVADSGASTKEASSGVEQGDARRFKRARTNVQPRGPLLHQYSDTRGFSGVRVFLALAHDAKVVQSFLRGSTHATKTHEILKLG
jgi:hypothetical protein